MEEDRLVLTDSTVLNKIRTIHISPKEKKIKIFIKKTKISQEIWAIKTLAMIFNNHNHLNKILIQIGNKEEDKSGKWCDYSWHFIKAIFIDLWSLSIFILKYLFRATIIKVFDILPKSFFKIVLIDFYRFH